MKGTFWLPALLVLATGPSMAQVPAKPIELSFPKLLETTPRGLKPTDLLTRSNGKRARISGFMAQVEDPTPGGFWLCPSPVFQDESGGGTGDLPPNAIFVKVRGAANKPVGFLRGLLSVSGVLKLNPHSPRIVITLDSAKDIAPTKRKS